MGKFLEYLQKCILKWPRNTLKMLGSIGDQEKMQIKPQ